MSLFPPDPTHNLLPCDGTVHYFGRVLLPSEADRYTETLLHHISWQHDEVVMFGKRIVTTREVAWYGDDHLSYTYSGTTRHALPWTSDLLQLKDLAERLTSSRYNACLLNLYHDGSEGMGWHSDDESSIVPNSAIASLSFGAERRFCFKHKQTHQTVEVLLEHGSLIVMKDSTQTHWLHSIPKTKKISLPRINLTFRLMIDQK